MKTLEEAAVWHSENPVDQDLNERGSSMSPSHQSAAVESRSRDPFALRCYQKSFLKV